MSDEIRIDGVIDKGDLLQQLEELEDGTLDPDDVEVLMSRLSRSPAARQIYLDYFQDSAALRHIAKVLDEQGRMPIVENRLASRRILRLSVMAAAAVVVLLGIVGALVGINSPAVPTVAALAAAGSAWAVDGEDQGTNHEELEIREGASVRVRSGTVRLEQESGCVLLIQGPAELSFPDPDRPVLRHGWLWIDTGGSGAKLEVDTPGLRIRNLGTRFGVRVTEDLETEVHLISGRVSIRSGEDHDEIALHEPGDFGTRFVSGESPVDVALATDPFPELPGLLDAAPDYRTTILSQTPAGYWRLDEDVSHSAANEVPSGSTGHSSGNVLIAEPGPGETDGFKGFPPSNRALRLGGDPVKSTLYLIDSPDGVSVREGAVSFWVRRQAREARKEVLWMAGAGLAGATAPVRSNLITRLLESGQVDFVIRSGARETTLSSTGGIADGRWHHVAASWSPSSADLYVDGKHVARESRSGDPPEIKMRGRFVRFGKPGIDLWDDHFAFTGWVDEIALWNRPLSPVEVALQFESAMGSAAKVTGR
jgi:ferric-dicitrate binding protein FerR (iron transport regulator)